jgi:hypothetical protein
MHLRTLTIVFALGAILIAASVSQATPIAGSIPLNPGGLTQNGPDLSASTIISATTLTTASVGTGDYAFIPLGTSFGLATLNYTSNATLSMFAFSNPVFGTFAAASDPQDAVLQKTPNFLDVFIVGIFTPGNAAGWAGKDPSLTGLRISVNQSGTSISAAITLNSPPIPPSVPEPSTMALTGSSLVGVGLILRRRFTS